MTKQDQYSVEKKVEKAVRDVNFWQPDDDDIIKVIVQNLVPVIQAERREAVEEYKKQHAPKPLACPDCGWSGTSGHICPKGVY